MLQVVLLGLLAIEAYGQDCPEQPEIMSNATNCIMVGDKKCNNRYTVINFRGEGDMAVPCQWSENNAMCQSRLDCSFEVPKCPETNTRDMAPFGQCGSARNEKQCKKSYQEQKMTGAIFRSPCRWDRNRCKWNKDCFTKVVPTMRPTPSPTMLPSMEPTMPPTMVPTRTPTSVPTRAPTKTPTNAPTNDYCNAFNFFKDTCIDFECYYIDDSDVCQQTRPFGYDCPTYKKKRTCVGDDECDWLNKKCIGTAPPTPEPTQDFTPFCSELFFDEEECSAWTDFAGCQWDPVAMVCRDFFEELSSRSPTLQPVSEPTVDCRSMKKNACNKNNACYWSGGKCKVEDRTCYVDFGTFELLGMEYLFVAECEDKPKSLNCMVLEYNDGTMECVRK